MLRLCDEVLRLGVEVMIWGCDGVEIMSGVVCVGL